MIPISDILEYLIQKKYQIKWLIFLLTAFANDYFNKIYTNKKITKLVQAEKQFTPLTLSFQMP